MFKDLLLIILGATVSCAYFYFQDYKETKTNKKTGKVKSNQMTEEQLKIIENLK